MKKRYILLPVLFLFLTAIGVFIPFYLHRTRSWVDFGGHRIQCNPRAQIDPEKSYRLQLWDYAWPVLQDHGGYISYLKTAIAAFQKIHPRIKVDVLLLDPSTGIDKLTNALQSGKPPDVFCSGPIIPPFDYRRQIPVGLYLTPEEQATYFKGLLDINCKHGILCSFPRWTVPRIWAGNKILLQWGNHSPEELQSSGWSWQKLSSASVPKGKFLLVGQPRVSWFEDPFYTTPSAQEHSLSILEQMGQNRMIPPDFDSNMLDRFFKGEALVLADIHPLLYRFVLDSPARTNNCLPCLLPPPGWNESTTMTVTNGIISVYRNSRSDDCTTAAVKLGYFLSTYRETAPWTELMMVPAARDAAARWRKETPVPETDLLQLCQWLDKYTVKQDLSETNFLEEIYPVIRKLCTGKITREEAINELSSLLRPKDGPNPTGSNLTRY